LWGKINPVSGALHHFHSPLEISTFLLAKIPSDLVQKAPLKSYEMRVDFPNELNYPLGCSKTNDFECRTCS